MSTKAKKVLGVLAAVGLLAGGVYGAFSATVSSTGNQFSTGSISISADGGASGVATQPVYFKANAVPGDTGNNGTECAKIANTGSTAGNSFKLYGSTSGTPNTTLTSALQLTIVEGTGNAKNCSDFVAGTTVYSGSLNAFQTGKTSFATGVDLGTLASGAAKTYKYSIVLPSGTDPSGIQNTNAGNQTFTWEIQS